MSDDLASRLEKAIRAIFPDCRYLAAGKITESLKKELTPTLFAIAKGRSNCSAEAGHMPVCRLGVRGTRQVICTPTEALIAHVGSTGVPPIAPKQAHHWLTSATAEAWKQSQPNKNDKLLFATLGPGDSFRQPAGWTYFAQVLGADFVGVRSAHFGIVDLPSLEVVNKVLIENRGASAVLQNAIDALAMVDNSTVGQGIRVGGRLRGFSASGRCGARVASRHETRESRQGKYVDSASSTDRFHEECCAGRSHGVVLGHRQARSLVAFRILCALVLQGPLVLVPPALCPPNFHLKYVS